MIVLIDVVLDGDFWCCLHSNTKQKPLPEDSCCVLAKQFLLIPSLLLWSFQQNKQLQGPLRLLSASELNTLRRKLLAQIFSRPTPFCCLEISSNIYFSETPLLAPTCSSNPCHSVISAVLAQHYHCSFVRLLSVVFHPTSRMNEKSRRRRAKLAFLFCAVFHICT